MSDVDMSSPKADWRDHARRVRSGIDIAAASRGIRERLTASAPWAGARTILIYAALPGEVDLLPLLEDAGRTFLLPRCLPGRRLAVHRVAAGECAWRAGAFGVREPDPERCPEQDPASIDLVVVPALAVDTAGIRLGYGGGYYDRFFAGPGSRAATIAAVPEGLLVERLPRDSWDIPVDWVCTEARFLPTTNGGTASGMV